MMMRYYDPERDNLVDGIYMSAGFLAFLRDVIREETGHHQLDLSKEGEAGLRRLVGMIHQCIQDISHQLHQDNYCQATAVLHRYLDVHPEVSGSLKQFLNRAMTAGFTSWEELKLE